MIRLTAAACVLLFGSGCAGGAAAPAVPAPEDAPGRAAAAILNDCRSSDAERELACHEAAVLDVLDREGVGGAMAVAERMGDLDPDVRREGHVYAHAVGLQAYTTPEEVGRVFESCTAAYQSGCYHGVIQSYFVDLARGDAAGVDEDGVNALCARQRGPDGDRWLLFQCAHGIGHGVTMLNHHHLKSSLEACDLVREDWEREACYGGAFMESLVQATTPHHSVGRPDHGMDAHGSAGEQPADAHPGHHPPSTEGEHDNHGMHEMDDSDDFPPLKADDPLYPCNALDERYLDACYHMQTSAIMFFNGSDVAGTVEVCQAAPARYRAACFQSLGRDVSAMTLQDHEAALELCALAGDRRFDCHWGYVKNVVDVTAQAEDGFEFCATIPDDEGRRRCYGAVGEQVWVLATDERRREEMCAGADPRYVEVCRRGAGLAGVARVGDRPDAPARN